MTPEQKKALAARLKAGREKARDKSLLGHSQGLSEE